MPTWVAVPLGLPLTVDLGNSNADGLNTEPGLDGRAAAVRLREGRGIQNVSSRRSACSQEQAVSS